MPVRPRADDRGMALIGVIVLTALLMSLAIALAVQVGSDSQVRGAFTSGVTGFYAAESGLNKGMGEYRNIFLDYNVPAGNDFNPRTFDLGDRTVTYKLSERAGNPQNIVIPSGEVFSGLNAIQYRYIVNSFAQNVNDDTEASVGAEFLVGYIPLFQFVAFYKNDLEILPGPDMVLNGRVHTNGKLYLNANNNLSIADNPAQGVFTVQVSAGQGIFRGRKDQNTCTGTVNVDKLEDVVAPFGDLDPKTLPCSGSSTREVPVSELVPWKGSMIRDIGNIAIPEPDIIKPPIGVSPGGSGDPGVYWDKADLRIVLHADQAGSLPGGPARPEGDRRRQRRRRAGRRAHRGAAAVHGGRRLESRRRRRPRPQHLSGHHADLLHRCAERRRVRRRYAGMRQLGHRVYNPPLPAPGAIGGPRAGAALSGVYSELMGNGARCVRSRLPPRRLLQPTRGEVDVAAQHQHPRPHPVERAERPAVLRHQRQQRGRPRHLRHRRRTGVRRPQSLRRARLRQRRHPAARRHRRLRRPDRRHRGLRSGDVRARRLQPRHRQRRHCRVSRRRSSATASTSSRSATG